ACQALSSDVANGRGGWRAITCLRAARRGGPEESNSLCRRWGCLDRAAGRGALWRASRLPDRLLSCERVSGEGRRGDQQRAAAVAQTTTRATERQSSLQGAR